MSVCVCRLFDPLYIFSAIRGCYLPDPRLEICPSHIHLLWSEIVPLNPNEFCHLICVFFQMRETWLSRTLWGLGSDCISDSLVPLCSHSHASHLEQKTATQSPGSETNIHSIHRTQLHNHLALTNQHHSIHRTQLRYTRTPGSDKRTQGLF